jgi:hypothetical protein
MHSETIEALYIGTGERTGLFALCGCLSWKTKRLKNAAGKALGLLATLLDESKNTRAVKFRKVFVALDLAQYRFLKLHLHLSTTHWDTAESKSGAPSVSNELVTAAREQTD